MCGYRIWRHLGCTMKVTLTPRTCKLKRVSAPTAATIPACPRRGCDPRGQTRIHTRCAGSISRPTRSLWREENGSPHACCVRHCRSPQSGRIAHRCQARFSMHRQTKSHPRANFLTHTVASEGPGGLLRRSDVPHQHLRGSVRSVMSARLPSSASAGSFQATRE